MLSCLGLTVPRSISVLIWSGKVVRCRPYGKQGQALHGLVWSGLKARSVSALVRSGPGLSESLSVLIQSDMEISVGKGCIQ